MGICCCQNSKIEEDEIIVGTVGLTEEVRDIEMTENDHGRHIEYYFYV